MRVETDRALDLQVAAGGTVLLLAVVWLLPESPLRVLLGLPFVLFFPGYVLVAALFPERAREVRRPDGETATEGLDALERVALSFGLSIAVVPLLGLALNYTPWGIRLVPVLATVSAWTLLLAAVAAVRRANVPPAARLRMDFEIAGPRWAEYGALDKALTVALAVAVLTAGGALAYVATTPRAGEAFTEFYVLGPGGRAEDYPTTLAPGAPGTLRVGVVNHEGDAVVYRVALTLTPGAFETNETGARRFVASGPAEEVTAVELRLADEERWEDEIVFAAPSAAGTYRLGLDLARDGEPGYRSLHLWLTVR